MQVMQPFRVTNALQIAQAVGVFIPGRDIKTFICQVEAVASVPAAEIEQVM
jgi:hypothetical protein